MASNSPTPPSDVPVATIEHDMSPLESFVDDNRKRLLWLAIAVVVVICAFIVLKFRARQAEVEAHGALTGAETAEELRSVIATYSDDVVAGSAELLLADQLWEEGKETESLETLRKFVENRTDHPLYFKALSDLGAHEHIQGNLDRAIELQQQASSAEAPVFVQQVALMRLGDAHTARALDAQAAGRTEEAEKHFEAARVAYEDLENRGVEGMKRLALARKQRLPILRVPAEPAPVPATGEATADSTASEDAMSAEPAGAETGALEMPPPPADPVTPEDEVTADPSEAEADVLEVPEPPDEADSAPADDPASVEAPGAGEGEVPAADSTEVNR